MIKTVLAHRLVALVGVGASALIGTACIPGVPLQPPPTPSGSCPNEGTWTLSSDVITNALNTLLGSATVTPVGTSTLTLTLTSGASGDTWAIGGSQTLNVTDGSNFNVTGTVTPTASGSDTQTGTSGVGGTGTITFSTTSASGTVTATGTAFGNPININWPLNQSGDIEGLYALNATANYTCNADGTLTLSLPNEDMDFHQ
jgi:hypothetical protein